MESTATIDRERLDDELRRQEWLVEHSKTGMLMVLVPGGKFLAGGSGSDGGGGRFGVELPGFYMGLHAVTNEQYGKFVRETGYGEMHNQIWKEAGKEEHPATNVNWDDAQAYCRWAGLRLPRELEWEKAARWVDGRRYPWGEEWDEGKCRNTKNKGYERTSQVWGYARGASPLGCYQMSGNVWEWCEDWYDTQAHDRYKRGNLQALGSGSSRVVRGGAWRNVYPLRFAVPYTCDGNPDARCIHLGFRCVGEWSAFPGIGEFSQSPRPSWRECSQAEIAAALEGSVQQRDWARLLTDCRALPLRHSLPGWQALAGSGWAAPDADDAALVTMVAQTLAGNDTPLALPDPPTGTSTIFEKWLAAGREGELTRLNEAILVDRLSKSVPPEGVPLVSALAAHGSLSDAAQKAVLENEHWLIRLAGHVCGAGGFDGQSDHSTDDNFWIRELGGAEGAWDFWPEAATSAHLAQLEQSRREGRLDAAGRVRRILHAIIASGMPGMVANRDAQKLFRLDSSDQKW